jgi:2-keto-4-pentenoate hydratase/2-oxohepta-3-ene-1,7-dioic acid hydratase in catechol pathway
VEEAAGSVNGTGIESEPGRRPGMSGAGQRRFVRFLDGGHPADGLVEGDQVTRLVGDPFAGFTAGATAGALGGLALLAPCQPAKVPGVGLNYRDHAREFGLDIPPEPSVLLKPATTVVGPGAAIVFPSMASQVDHEGELAAVIGRRLHRASPAEAEAGILGYTCANDVTARDLQKKDVQLTRAKAFDTFCPLGPAIVTGLDPSALRVQVRVNGEVRQDGSTRDMAFHPVEIVAYLSRIMTLLPGDVVITGTPRGCGPMWPGDVVEVEIEGIGVLRNPVVAEPGSPAAR